MKKSLLLLRLGHDRRVCSQQTLVTLVMITSLGLISILTISCGTEGGNPHKQPEKTEENAQNQGKTSEPDESLTPDDAVNGSTAPAENLSPATCALTTLALEATKSESAPGFTFEYQPTEEEITAGVNVSEFTAELRFVGDTELPKTIDSAIPQAGKWTLIVIRTQPATSEDVLPPPVIHCSADFELEANVTSQSAVSLFVNGTKTPIN